MRSHRKTSSALKRRVQHPSHSKKFAAVIGALDSVNSGRSFVDPMLEQLQQCPEAFKAGELVGKMFEALKYHSEDCEGGDRLLPPAGLVMPLV